MKAEMNLTAVWVFAAFVLVSLLVTWWAAVRTRSAGEFYTAGSRITDVQNGLALAGDFMSAATFLGLTGLAFMGGVDALQFAIGGTVGWAIILFIVADRLRNLGRFTFADVVAFRLHPERLRVLAAIGTLIVAVPYLIAQMVGAGGLFQALFALPYSVAVLIVGGLMTTYVALGGMLGTTWVQVIKAVLLLTGGSALAVLALLPFGFDLGEMFSRASDIHPLGDGILAPGGLYTDPVSVVSLALAFIGGTAGLPHILMRFFTVPDARQARNSIGYAVVFIGYFMGLTVIIGFAAIVLLAGETQYVDESGRIAGGANMIAVYLARHAGGEAFFGFISAVAFATILAVVSGILLSASASVAHDLYARVIRRGDISDRQEIRVSRIATVVIGAIAIALSILFRNLNIGVISALVLAIAASVNFPVLVLALFWSGLTTRGALWGGSAGLLVVIVLTVLSPSIWVNVLGHEEAIYPYAYPTLFSMLVAFAVTIAVSLADRSRRAEADRAAYWPQLVQSELGQVS
jgi:cation/acetate symporter